jgi:NAD(P)-dependent dehydrogenase (short-subunit alcohol dehydrogenase family)
MSKLGSRSTAEQALQGQNLKGKKAIVTGANSGLGVETARVLALAGADVMLACRSVEAGEKVANELRASLPAGSGVLTVGKLDLSDLKSVKSFAESYSAPSLDLLINNAGIMATPFGTTAQGFEQQMGTNHLGHFLLTKLLLPKLEKSPAARIVTLSSSLHDQGKKESILSTLDGDPTFKQKKYKPFPAYGDSKLANILFTRALTKRLPPNVLTFSVHPGVIATNLSRSMGVAGSLLRSVGKLFLKTVPQGAATTIYAATAPELASRSGIYLSDCAEKAPIKDAFDQDLAEKVWTLSERAVASV